LLLGNGGGRWRCLVVWTSGTSCLGTGAVLLRDMGQRAWADRCSLGSLPLDRAISDVAVAVLLLCLAWAWLVLTTAVAEAWSGAPHGRRSYRPPTGVRRVILAACGVALLSAGTSPALATGAAGHRDRPARLHGAALLTGLPLPERAVMPRRTPHPIHVSHFLVVRPGDSLWAIARRELPPDASDAEVTARWHAIYAANRGAIGPDPDVVRPGQRLLLPRRDPS
jgi:hypothetical protein